MSEGPLWRDSVFFHPETAHSRPLVGCSACLLGEPVRYDGGHKEQSHFATSLLPWIQLQAICPEVGIGLGVPRPTLKVIDSDFGQRVVGVENPSQDVTDALVDYADSYARRIGRFWPLTAYIFKARSPSCGVNSAPVNPGETAEHTGYGAFAGRFRTFAPWLSLYEEEELISESACMEMLLMSYICADILWRDKQSEMAAIADHYAGQLGVALKPGQESIEALWEEIRRGWQSLPNPARRDRLQSLRAGE